MHHLPKFTDAFHLRRAIIFAKTFDEGREVSFAYENGTRTGKSWTQQWTLRQKEGRRAIIGVIDDQFDVGHGPDAAAVWPADLSKADKLRSCEALL